MMEFEQSFNQSQEMQWKQEPFTMVDGIEVLDNMHENGKNLQAKYKEIRRHILTPPFDKATFVIGFGDTRTSKGHLLQGLRRVSMKDDYLGKELNKRGVERLVTVLPFSLYAQAAKTEQVHQENPELWVNNMLQHGQYDEQDYRNMSLLMWRDLQQDVIRQQYQGKAIVVFIEANATSVPVMPARGKYIFNDPVDVEGFDRCNSPIYTLLLDERTRDNVYLFQPESNRTVGQTALKWREKLAYGQDATDVLSGDTYIQFSKTFGGETEEIAIAALSKDTQKAVIDFLLITMAPPTASIRISNEYRQMIEQIYQRGLIRMESDDDYLKFLRETFKLPRRQATFIQNPVLLGPKTFDLDYFLYSLPSKKYPEMFYQVKDALGIIP